MDSCKDIVQVKLQTRWFFASLDLIDKSLCVCSKTIHAEINQQKFGFGKNETIGQLDASTGSGCINRTGCCPAVLGNKASIDKFNDKLNDSSLIATTYFIINDLLNGLWRDQLNEHASQALIDIVDFAQCFFLPFRGEGQAGR
jgi:hypothetical protein